MATIPPDDDSESQPTTVERIARTVAAPIADRPQPIVLLALAAGAGTLAPDPFAAIAAIACVLVAADYGRRR